MGADIAIDRDHGPVFLELNARPGLSIQIANLDGLLGRLQRVEGLKIKTAEKGVADRAAYSASKGALLSLTRAMARDHLAENIRVNCVSPGTTYTPSLERRLQAFADPEKARAEFVARQPMGRFGRDDEIAAAILFAAADDAAFMNGENISINGGMTI